MKNIRLKSTWVLFIGALLVISSCSKHDDNPGTGAPETQQQKLDKRIKSVISKIPSMKVTNSANAHRFTVGGGPVKTQDGGFSFADPNGGFGFSSPAGIIFSYLTNTIYASQASFGNNPNSGTVVAGPSSLDINFTFCFTSDSSSMGLDLFSTGAPTSGISAVIGVSGDFKALANANDSTSFADIFKGLAFYFVYDGQASGSYPVIDWSGAAWDSSSVANKCFAFVLDFQSGRLFVSKSGAINVSGGSMNFNGDYYEVSGFINDQGNFDLTGNNLTLSTVAGFGTMGCN